MYQFIDLTADQKHVRRERLDWYGFMTGASVLVPLVWIQFSILAGRLQRWRNSGKARRVPPSSPYMKQRRLEQPFSLADRGRRITWWCGDDVRFIGLYLGPRGEVIGASVWLAWLLLSCFLDTGNDYLEMTKRFGTVAASQLPWHYLLSMKSPYSPLQFITQRSHESLIAIHQLLGRVITFLLYGHAVLYLNFYIQKGLLGEKLTEFYVLCGIFGIIAFTVLGTTALKSLRDKNYSVFYIVHVTLATALLPVLYFHCSHIRVYLWETLAVYTVTAVLRFIATKTHAGTVSLVAGTNLVEINIPLADSTGRHSKFEPGQHAYLALPGHPLSRTFRSNPFTVASIPAIDGQLKFVARVLDGNTAKLASNPSSPLPLSIEGPYGIRTHPEALLRYDRVLFVAGGVGATFIVPLYRQLLADLSPSRGSQRRQKVSFIWVARTLADVNWALPAEEKEKDGFVERLQVYLTRDTENVSSTGGPIDDFTIGEDDEGEEQTPLAVQEEGIELEESKKLLTEDGTGKTQVSELSARAGRPDCGRIVEQAFSHSGTDRVAVIVCGPKSLSRALRKEVGRWVGRGRDVFFWDESFGI